MARLIDATVAEAVPQLQCGGHTFEADHLAEQSNNIIWALRDARKVLKSNGHDELAFPAGDVIADTDDDPADWWKGGAA